MTPMIPRAAVGCLVLGAAAALAAPPAVAVLGQAELSARQHANAAALVVIDVRTPAEYAAGHVPGAINVPHDQVKARLPELDSLRDRDLVVYCKSGWRAGLALEALASAGFTHLWHLDGDMEAWTASGRPVEKPAPSP
jgi:phage shock protein E